MLLSNDPVEAIAVTALRRPSKLLPMRLIETFLALCSVLAGFFFPRLGWRLFAALESALYKFSTKRLQALIAVGILALLLRAALLPILPIPTPIIGDEFGYLLQSDTFMHGRITNPTHPMWEHFDTFNVLQKPSYQCFMQPAQGVILALGELIAGHPFWGVWFSVGMMSGSICWMLQGWFPPQWALVGGLLAILRFATFSYWANGYMGGAIAATGGALVLGALPRILRSPRSRDAVAMGLGCALLAGTRPYEGFVFCLPIAIAILLWICKRSGPSLEVRLRTVITPLVAILTVTAAVLAFYFYRITGNPFVMPYHVHQKTYAIAPYFIFQALAPVPLYRHAAIREAYAGLYVDIYRFARTPIGVLAKAYWVWNFFLGPALTLPILLAIAVLPYGFTWKQISRETRFLLLLFATSLLGLMLETYYGAHYAAPMTGLLLALVLVAMRRARSWQWRAKPVGVFITRMVPIICLIMTVLRCLSGPLHVVLARSPEPAWFEARSEDFGRAAIIKQLNQLPGKHLVLVHYRRGHPFVREWVYNDADIDNSKIVWAHEMSTREDNDLIDYFHERQVWLLDADNTPPALLPWRETEQVQ